MLAPLVLGLVAPGCWREEVSAAAPAQVTIAVPAPASETVAGGNAPPAPPPPAPNAPEFSEAVDHAFMPLLPGTVRIYEGTDDGRARRDRVVVLAETELILGTACTAVHQQVHLDGELAEDTTEWFAADAEGNVWKFGEESLEFEEGVPLLTEDSWRAGRAGAAPWMVLAADPRPGDVYAALLPEGREEVTVVGLAVTAQVAAGLFGGCLEVVEAGSDDPGEPVDVEDADRIIYAPGVGMVSEESPSGRIELVSFGPG
jgi:hypothetical protein